MEMKRPPPSLDEGLQPRHRPPGGAGDVEQQHHVDPVERLLGDPAVASRTTGRTGEPGRAQRGLEEERLVPVAHRACGAPFTTSARSSRGTCSTKARRSSSASASGDSMTAPTTGPPASKRTVSVFCAVPPGGNDRGSPSPPPARRAPPSPRGPSPARRAKFRTVKVNWTRAGPACSAGSTSGPRGRGWAAPSGPAPRPAAPPRDGSARPPGPARVGGGASSRSEPAVKVGDHHQPLAGGGALLQRARRQLDARGRGPRCDQAGTVRSMRLRAAARGRSPGAAAWRHLGAAEQHGGRAPPGRARDGASRASVPRLARRGSGRPTKRIDSDAIQHDGGRRRALAAARHRRSGRTTRAAPAPPGWRGG